MVEVECPAVVVAVVIVAVVVAVVIVAVVVVVDNVNALFYQKSKRGGTCFFVLEAKKLAKKIPSKERTQEAEKQC